MTGIRKAQPIKWYTDVLTMGIMLGVLFLFYPTILMHLNDFCFGNGGDGLKNYYTFIYHLKYGSDLTQFMGMNYPYGEHIIYGDAQPALLHFSQFIKLIFPNIANYGVGIINGAMFLSMMVGVVFVRRILILWGLPTWYSILGGVMLILMSPQTFRFGGHYGLAYVCFIPMIWYFVLMYKDSTNFKWLVYSFLALFLFSLLHLYYLLIGGAFLILLWLIDAYRSKDKWSDLGHWKQILMQVILPTICVFIYLKSGDSMTDRPTNPWGFLFYTSWVEGLLVNFNMPLVQWINQNWVKIRFKTIEGMVYLGFPVVVYFLVITYKGLVDLVKHKSITKFFIRNEERQNAFFAALILVIFSMGIPFIFGLEGLVDYLSLLKQFRSIGRFAWLFYYVFGAISLYHFYFIISKWRESKNVVMLTFTAILFLVWVYEVELSHGSKNDIYQNNREAGYWEEVGFQLQKLDIDKYDFIVPVPFFHVGSEKINVTTPLEPKELFFNLSIATGIPTPAVLLSRTSMSQTLENLKLTCGGVSTPEWFKGEKPLLLLFKVGSKLEGNQRVLFNNSKLVFKNNRIILKEFSIENYKMKKLLFDDYEKSITNSLVKVDLKNVVSDVNITQGDTMELVQGENTLFQGALSNLRKGQLYIKICVKTNFRDGSIENGFCLDQFDSKGGFKKRMEFGFLAHYHDNDNGWIQLKIPTGIFIGDKSNSNFRFILNQGESNESILVSDLEFLTINE